MLTAAQRQYRKHAHIEGYTVHAKKCSSTIEGYIPKMTYIQPAHVLHKHNRT